MKRILSLFLILLISQLTVKGQVLGVSKYGFVKSSGTDFVNQYGGTLNFPRLNRFGHLLYYAPIIQTDTIFFQGTDSTSVQLCGSILFNGWSTITQRGFEYGQSATLDGATTATVTCPGEAETYCTRLTGLTANKTYYARAFATNEAGTVKGNILQIRTPIGPLTISALQFNNITPTSAYVIIPITQNGNNNVSGDIYIFPSDDTLHPIHTLHITPTAAMPLGQSVNNLVPDSAYYVKVVLTNQRDTQTLWGSFRTSSDLVLAMEQIGDVVYPCDSPHNCVYSFAAHLTGSDPHKSLYQFSWSTPIGYGVATDSNFIVSASEGGSSQTTITVCATYNDKRLSKSLTFTTAPARVIPYYKLCTNEYLNTATLTTYEMDSVFWLDTDGVCVATTASVTLPTGDYTVHLIDRYGCPKSEQVRIGKHSLQCTSTHPLAANESGIQADSIWLIDSLSDYEGNWYAVGQYGEDCWMRQNLRTRVSPINGIDLYRIPASSYDPYLLYPSGALPDKLEYYGAVYNWAAAFGNSMGYYGTFTPSDTSYTQGICPDGWHIPSYQEFENMFTAVVRSLYPDLFIDPPFSFSSGYIGTSTPILNMLNATCYYSVSSPKYPKIVYNYSRMNMIPCGYRAHDSVSMLWANEPVTTTLAPGIKLMTGGVMKSNISRQECAFIRCVRNK